VTRRRGRTPRAFPFLILILILIPAPLLAQGPSAQAPAQGVVAGARVGIDYFSDALVLGAQVHIQPDPWGLFDLMPNAEVSRRGGSNNWQLNADLAVMPLRGLYAGGGAAFRHTLYEEDRGLETRTGYSVFAGLRPPPERGELNPQIELRWTFVGDFQRPRTITVGANWPLLLWR